MTVDEAAVVLGVSRSSLYLLAKRGELPGAIKLGKRIILSRAIISRLVGDQ
jgi:excisionase family DNA binding protein